jgi:hypothetical protein
MAIPELPAYTDSTVKEIAAIEKIGKLPGAREMQPGFPVAYDSPIGSSLQRVPAKYYLEIRKGSKIDSVTSFPYDPQSLNYSRPEPVNITHTIGGTIRETNTIRSHGVTATGRSGIAHRVGYNRKGNIIYASGQTIFNEFDEFLKRYRELSTQLYGVPSRLVKGKGGGTTVISSNRLELGGDDGIQMILRCVDEDLHLVVEPTGFSWDKGIESARFDCFWTVNFQAYGYPAYGPYRNVFLDALNRYDQVLATVGGFVGMLGNIVNNVSNDYISRIRGSIQNTAATMQVAIDLADSANGIYHNAVGVVADAYRIGIAGKAVGARYERLFTSEDWATSNQQITQASTDFNNYGLDREARGIPTNTQSTNDVAQLETAQSALSAPPVEPNNDQLNYQYAQYIQASSQLYNSLEIMRGNIPNEVYLDSLKQNARTAEEIRGAFLANERNYAKIYGPNVSTGRNADTRDRENVIEYTMKKHEDLKSVAAKVLGSESDWMNLATLNQWRDARRDANGDYPEDGKKILIPIQEVQGINKFNKRGDLFGVDLYMDFNDLEFTDSGDFKTVSGIDNVEQSIKNVLMTKPGELPGFDDYGFPNLYDINDVAYTISILRDTLINDPRIIDVSNIVLETDEEDDTRLNISCDVTTVQQDKVSVRAPIV